MCLSAPCASPHAATPLLRKVVSILKERKKFLTLLNAPNLVPKVLVVGVGTQTAGEVAEVVSVRRFVFVGRPVITTLGVYLRGRVEVPAGAPLIDQFRSSCGIYKFKHVIKCWETPSISAQLSISATTGATGSTGP